MEYRRLSLVVNQQQIANAKANSHAYASFAGGSSNRNAVGLTDALTKWWNDERIGLTVNRQFVASKLRPDEQEKLDEAVCFGDSLTDDTYMDWIEQKAKKIFLILSDLGVPDQIFGVIDDSWDDDDLPIPFEHVEKLRLTYNKDEKLERRFFQWQFYYLLKYIHKGDHVSYDDMELVPLELIDLRSLTASFMPSQNSMDRVTLPGRTREQFLRRRVPLGTGPGQTPKDEFMSYVETLKAIQHDHCTSLWASYIHKGNAYLLLTPMEETNLSAILKTLPQSIKILPKEDRRTLLLTWLHCLAEAVSYLHSRGSAHGNIHLSSIMLDSERNIFLEPSEHRSIATSSLERRKLADERYEHTAPEAALLPSRTSTGSTSTERRPSLAAAVARRSFTLFTTNPSGPTSSNDMSTYASQRLLMTHRDSLFSSNSNPFAISDPLKSDIFSLATVYLEILTLLLKRTSRAFSTHRSSYSKALNGSAKTAFHATIPALHSWMKILQKDVSKKEDVLFSGIGNILELVARMLSVEPGERPSAAEVKERIGQILTANCQMEARMHCFRRQAERDGLARGLEEARLEDQRKAAEACEAVKNRLGDSIERRDIALGNGGLIKGVEGRKVVVREASRKDGLVCKSRDRSSRAGNGDKEKQKVKDEEGKLKERYSIRPRRKDEGGHTDTNKDKSIPRAWQAPVYAELSFG